MKLRSGNSPWRAEVSGLPQNTNAGDLFTRVTGFHFRTPGGCSAFPGIERLGQELTLSLPGEAIYLKADSTRLDQIFGKLLGNTSNYSGPGGRIGLSAERAAAPGPNGPEVLVTVRDTGIGTAPDVLPHVFDLFVQADRASERAYGGLGIGLTLVQRLVELHGGSVEAWKRGSAERGFGTGQQVCGATAGPAGTRRSAAAAARIDRKGAFVPDADRGRQCRRRGDDGDVAGTARAPDPLRFQRAGRGWPSPRGSSPRWFC